MATVDHEVGAGAREAFVGSEIGHQVGDVREPLLDGAFAVAGENRPLEAQRDFFDHANAGAVFGAMAKNGQLTEKMLARTKKGSKMPGWTRRSEFDWFETLVDAEA